MPFALVGGIGALWLRGLNLNISAAIGFIALFGQAVLNGVVMLSHFGQLRTNGESVYDAVFTLVMRPRRKAAAAAAPEAKIRRR